MSTDAIDQHETTQTPPLTAWERFQRAFLKLHKLGILTRHDFGLCPEDADEKITGEWIAHLEETGEQPYGYCYYTEEDALKAGVGYLPLHFGVVGDHSRDQEVGELVAHTLHEHGLDIEWESPYLPIGVHFTDQSIPADSMHGVDVQLMWLKKACNTCRHVQNPEGQARAILISIIADLLDYSYKEAAALPPDPQKLNQILNAMDAKTVPENHVKRAISVAMRKGATTVEIIHELIRTFGESNATTPAEQPNE